MGRTLYSVVSHSINTARHCFKYLIHISEQNKDLFLVSLGEDIPKQVK